MVDMTSFSSERGFPFSVYLSDFLAAAGRLKLPFDGLCRASQPGETEMLAGRSGDLFRAAPAGFVRQKYFGAALLVLCAVYVGGLLSLYTPFLSGMAGRFTAVNYRNLPARPMSHTAILAPKRVQMDFAAIPEIRLVTLDLQKIETESEADRSLRNTGRASGTAALRKATDHVLGFVSNAPAAITVPRTEPSIQDIGRLAAPQLMVAMYLKVPKDMSASNGRPKSFGESQRVAGTDDASNQRFAKNAGNSCGGFAAGRQSSDFAHGVKGTNSSFGRRSSGTGISVPELNWKWCAL